MPVDLIRLFHAVFGHGIDIPHFGATRQGNVQGDS